MHSGHIAGVHPPESLFNCMGPIVAIWRDDEWAVKNVCKWHRDSFDALGIAVPGNVELGIQIYGQSEVDETRE